MNYRNRVGEMFGTWTVLADSGERSRIGQVLWSCRCVCGNIRLFSSSELARGRSCGCVDNPRPTRHGLTGTPTYSSWMNMKVRCSSPATNGYERYGGRGITVCERWKSFKNFLADMGERPEGMSLDRLDPNGDYEPGNCKWSTALEQQNNKRSNRVIEYNGESMTMTQWARKLGMRWDVLQSRLDNWDVERAFTTPLRPPRKRAKPIEHAGKVQSLLAWSREVGIKPNAIRERLNRGWDVARALSPTEGRLKRG